jgi:hypothetical protein
MARKIGTGGGALDNRGIARMTAMAEIPKNKYVTVLSQLVEVLTPATLQLLRELEQDNREALAQAAGALKEQRDRVAGDMGDRLLAAYQQALPAPAKVGAAGECTRELTQVIASTLGPLHVDLVLLLYQKIMAETGKQA